MALSLPTRRRGGERPQPITQHDNERRRREDNVALSVALEMLAEQIVRGEDGSMIVTNHGRTYKVEVKAFEIGADA